MKGLVMKIVPIAALAALLAMPLLAQGQAKNNDKAVQEIEATDSGILRILPDCPTTGATVPEDTMKAETDLTQATANLNLAQSIADSRAQLFAEGAIPGRDLDTAKAALVQAKASHEIARQHLEFFEELLQIRTVAS